MESVVPDESGQGVAVRSCEGLKWLRLAEDRPPLRAPRAELCLWRERQVDLEPARQEEHADESRSGVVVSSPRTARTRSVSDQRSLSPTACEPVKAAPAMVPSASARASSCSR